MNGYTQFYNDILKIYNKLKDDSIEVEKENKDAMKKAVEKKKAEAKEKAKAIENDVKKKKAAAIKKAKAIKNDMERKIAVTTMKAAAIEKDVDIKIAILDKFFKSFERAFNLWKGYLKNCGRVPFHIGLAEEILYLGLLDSDYTSGSNGKSSPFGPWLSPLQEIGKKGISIKRAFEQQMLRTKKDGGNLVNGHLVNAQKLANEVYGQFLKVIYENKLEGNLKPGSEYPPIIQLCRGGAATLFKDFTVPTIIIIDGEKNWTLSEFSALPHELGHAISGAFKNSTLIEEITQKVVALDIKHINYWKRWIEECLADAIAVCIIYEGEILSLRHILSRYETNIIRMEKRSKMVAVHPIPHIRVLLTIEVGRILRKDKKPVIDPGLLNDIESEWYNFGKLVNRNYNYARIDGESETIGYLMSDFDDRTVLKQIARILIDTPHNALKGKTVREIFSVSDSTSNLRVAMKNAVCNNKRKLP